MRTTGDEIRDLVLSATDVTFSIEDVLETFKRLRGLGITNTEVLREVALNIDTISDAAGVGAGDIAKYAHVFKVLGIDLENLEDAFPALQYVISSTGFELTDFFRLLEQWTPLLQDMGVSFDETAILMGDTS